MKSFTPNPQTLIPNPSLPFNEGVSAYFGGHPAIHCPYPAPFEPPRSRQDKTKFASDPNRAGVQWLTGWQAACAWANAGCPVPAASPSPKKAHPLIQGSTPK